MNDTTKITITLLLCLAVLSLIYWLVRSSLVVEDIGSRVAPVVPIVAPVVAPGVPVIPVPNSSLKITFGNYGVLTDFGDVTKTTSNTQIMVNTLGVRDVQFFDWANNYSGIFQSYDRGTWTGGASTKPGWWSSTPNWWKNDAWTDTYFGTSKIKRDAILSSIKVIKDSGGRAWAYLQAQTSEFLNLAGDWEGCGDIPNTIQGNIRKNDPQTITIPDGKGAALFDFYGPGEEQTLRKYIKSDGIWTCQPGKHQLPAYAMNGPLARYQCNAWIPILLDLGFSGVHWDMFATGDSADEARGVAEYMRVAGSLLKKKGLLQTFNNVFGFYPYTLFDFGVGRSLLFPYTETWTNKSFEGLLQVAKMYPGAVAARYTGGKAPITDRACCETIANHPRDKGPFYKCGESSIGQPFKCVTNPTSCTSGVADWGESSYKCPIGDDGYPLTQQQLSVQFWNECCEAGARLLIIADGMKQIQQDYFRDSVSICPELLKAIQATLVKPCSVPDPMRDDLLQSIENSFQNKYGLLIHMANYKWLDWIKDAKLPSDIIVEPAYTVWQSSLPLSVFRMSGDACPSFGLLYDGEALNKHVLCMSAIDRDSNMRQCCGCYDPDDDYCKEGGPFYTISSNNPSWQSPYCPQQGETCDTVPAGSTAACRLMVSGCGSHLWEVKTVCDVTEEVAKGTCDECTTMRWDAYGDKTRHPEELFVTGVQDHAHQSVYNNENWDLFMQRTKELSDKLKTTKSPSLQVYENEVSIYVEEKSKTYATLQKDMMDALRGVLFIPQDCETNDKMATALATSCQAATILSRVLKRPVPVISLTVEKFADLSLYNPGVPVERLQDPPYNLKIVHCA